MVNFNLFNKFQVQLGRKAVSKF